GLILLAECSHHPLGQRTPRAHIPLLERILQLVNLPSALVCALYFVPVSGYIPDRPVIKYLAAQRNIEIAFVPIAGTRLLVPFRMTIPTPLGQAMLEATSFVTTAAPPRVAKTQ
ncbi:MAG: hypothetical protein ACK47P_30520, partial [Bradyrhizobium sp.]